MENYKEYLLQQYYNFYGYSRDMEFFENFLNKLDFEKELEYNTLMNSIYSFFEYDFSMELMRYEEFMEHNRNRIIKDLLE